MSKSRCHSRPTAGRSWCLNPAALRPWSGASLSARSLLSPERPLWDRAPSAHCSHLLWSAPRDGSSPPLSYFPNPSRGIPRWRPTHTACAQSAPSCLPDGLRGARLARLCVTPAVTCSAPTAHPAASSRPATHDDHCVLSLPQTHDHDVPTPGYSGLPTLSPSAHSSSPFGSPCTDNPCSHPGHPGGQLLSFPAHLLLHLRSAFSLSLL